MNKGVAIVDYVPCWRICCLHVSSVIIWWGGVFPKPSSCSRGFRSVGTRFLACILEGNFGTAVVHPGWVGLCVATYACELCKEGLQVRERPCRPFSHLGGLYKNLAMNLVLERKLGISLMGLIWSSSLSLSMRLIRRRRRDMRLWLSASNKLWTSNQDIRRTHDKAVEFLSAGLHETNKRSARNIQSCHFIRQCAESMRD